jgi:hypothetical protein
MGLFGGNLGSIGLGAAGFAIGGPIGASLVASGAGGLLGGGAGGGTNTITQQSVANPFTAQGSLFNTSFGPTSQPGVNTGGGTLGNLTNQVREGQGPLGLNLGISDPTLQGISQQGLFGAQDFFNQAQNNPNAALAGQLGGGFLEQLGTFNPLDVAQNQFGLLSPILNEQFTQDRLSQENRQFAQGRLGSTGGAQDVNALLDSQNDARRKLLFESFGQGQQAQNQLFNLGSGLSQLDPQLRGLFGGLGTNFLNVPLSIQQAGLNQAQIAGSLAGANTSGTLTNPGQSFSQQIGAGLINSGVSGLTSGLEGLFQPPTGINFDPSIAQGAGGIR